ncbi:hypothetical protein RY831_32330 [Noviherbaspirillum sp. CPCC 100848]|uniref:Transposase n=1 Tax=Noviherbaspirillum album TaxID=3080276 RepID=A0ABU6JJW1_9BURK|nr:hypothetical protein [Noviherbaspirillum sp. CPCC 100848]MEC4723808.1 hypothetical protein [Noviherbaspirillum sp. CPCC 100848]
MKIFTSPGEDIAGHDGDVRLNTHRGRDKFRLSYKRLFREIIQTLLSIYDVLPYLLTSEKWIVLKLFLHIVAVVGYERDALGDLSRLGQVQKEYNQAMA